MSEIVKIPPLRKKHRYLLIQVRALTAIPTSADRTERRGALFFHARPWTSKVIRYTRYSWTTQIDARTGFAINRLRCVGFALSHIDTIDYCIDNGLLVMSKDPVCVHQNSPRWLGTITDLGREAMA